ncbi:MAG: hypothetical protein ACJAZ4_001970 [Neptuniibacter pectenicola]|jgi:hypothetical protein
MDNQVIQKSLQRGLTLFNPLLVVVFLRTLRALICRQARCEHHGG